MKSVSPFNDMFEYQINENKEIENINKLIQNHRKNIVIQGLGFVGAAMLAAVGHARDKTDNVLYNVIGVDLPDEKNYWKIGLVNSFRPPVMSTDEKLKNYYQGFFYTNNVYATYSDYAFSIADIVIVDIHLDIIKNKLGETENYSFSYNSFCNSLKTVAEKVQENTLIIIETTVPPGTTEKVIYPLFQNSMIQRKLNPQKIYIAHSYERVTPGVNYLDSIVNNYRVFSGINQISKDKTREFLESIINTTEYPLSEIESTNGSEMAKVLENSYRALNIAFIQEWTEFAERAEINLFEVIDAIRKRPTHKNIMQPGFGVGGYCLTKDSLLADWSEKKLFDGKTGLQLSVKAIEINDVMPIHTFNVLNTICELSNCKGICIFGVSYLNDIADTRNSPTELLYSMLIDSGLNVIIHDPIVKYWIEKNIFPFQQIENLKLIDINIAIFTVKHNVYKEISSEKIMNLLPDLKILIDANNVIEDSIAYDLSEKGIYVYGIGKGHWKKYNKSEIKD